MRRERSSQVDVSNSPCVKCGATSREHSELRASGGFWSSFFDVNNRRFHAVSCTRCGHTEFYKASIAGSVKLLDFLGGG